GGWLATRRSISVARPASPLAVPAARPIAALATASAARNAATPRRRREWDDAKPDRRQGGNLLCCVQSLRRPRAAEEIAMKRSEVNAIMREADAFFAKQGFYLPPFAHWSPEDWAKKGPEVGEIVDRRLGWDITDFGRNDFCSCGITLFTIRNGPPEDLARGKGKLYCEKILMFRRDQRCPYHFHWL